MQQRITAVEKYLAGSPGSIGVVLDDRVTGAIWRNANAPGGHPELPRRISPPAGGTVMTARLVAPRAWD